MAAEILQKPKNVVPAFMHILHLGKMCARLHWLAVVSLTWLYCSVYNIVAAAVCLQGCSVCIGWLLLALTWLYCSVCSIVAAAVCLHGCSVCIGWLLLALHGCTVVYAVLQLLPFAYKAAVYASVDCC